jgi:DNA-binding NarL/FixJ family response regulator
VRLPQLLIYEGDGRLAALLRAMAEEQRWAVREPRQLASCLRLLRRGGPAVLVIRVGRNLEREMTLVERTHAFFPDTAIVVVGDLDQAPLAGLAWDLGADAVVFPPLPRDGLPEIVLGLMASRREEPGRPLPTLE